MRHYHTGQKQPRRHYWCSLFERVLSLLNNTFGKRQTGSPEDYVESCSIIIVNYHFYVGIFGHKIGHNRAKIMAMPKR